MWNLLSPCQITVQSFKTNLSNPKQKGSIILNTKLRNQYYSQQYTILISQPTMDKDINVSYYFNNYTIHTILKQQNQINLNWYISEWDEKSDINMKRNKCGRVQTKHTCNPDPGFSWLAFNVNFGFLVRVMSNIESCPTFQQTQQLLCWGWICTGWLILVILCRARSEQSIGRDGADWWSRRWDMSRYTYNIKVLFGKQQTHGLCGQRRQKGK
jgi:hypothetical protein